MMPIQPPVQRDPSPEGRGGALGAFEMRLRDALGRGPITAWMLLLVVLAVLVRGGVEPLLTWEGLVSGALIFGAAVLHRTLLGDFLAGAAMGPLFIVVAKTSTAAATGHFDAGLAAFDRWMLGASAAQWFEDQMPWRWWKEWMALAYLSYYFWIPAPWLLAVRRGVEARQWVMGTLLGSYCASTTLELVFPTIGPLVTRGAVVDPTPLSRVVDLIYALDPGGGAAFPSSHVTVGVACWWMVLRLSPRAGWWSFPILVSMLVSTVQGCFHYTLDVPAGILAAGGVILLRRESMPPVRVAEESRALPQSALP